MKKYLIIGGFVVSLMISFLFGRASIKLYKPPAYNTTLRERINKLESQLDETYRLLFEADADTEMLLARVEEVRTQRGEELDSSGAVTAQQWDVRKAQADALLRAGKMHEALKAYLWCYKNAAAKSRRARSDMRRQLVSMSNVFPPAMDALKDLRDAAEKLAHKQPMEQVNYAAFQEMVTLNKDLGDHERTEQIFNTLSETDPRRWLAGGALFDFLVGERRYEDAVTAKTFAQMLMAVDRLEQRMQQVPAGSVQGQMNIRAALTQDVVKNVEALAGAGKAEEARVLLRRLLDNDPSVSTRSIIMEHLRRAGHPELLSAAHQ